MAIHLLEIILMTLGKTIFLMSLIITTRFSLAAEYIKSTNLNNIYKTTTHKPGETNHLNNAKHDDYYQYNPNDPRHTFRLEKGWYHSVISGGSSVIEPDDGIATTSIGNYERNRPTNKVLRIDTNKNCRGGNTSTVPYCLNSTNSPGGTDTPAGRKEMSLVTFWESNSPKLGAPSKTFHYEYHMRILGYSRDGYNQKINYADSNRDPWAIINQLHQHCESPYSAMPQFSIEVDRKSYALGSTINLKFVLRGNRRLTNESYKNTNLVPNHETPITIANRRIAYNQWYKVVVDGRVSTGNDGYLKAKIANDVMIDYHGPLGLFPNTSQNSKRSCGNAVGSDTFDIRVGAYHSSGTGRLVIDFDNLIYRTSM